MCKTPSKGLNTVTTQETYNSDTPDSDADDQFIGIVTDSSHTDKWNITVKLNGTNIKFKLDTGADISVISDKQFWTLQPTTVYPAKATLTGAGNQPLQVQGKFNATLTYKSRSLRQTIYVVRDLRHSFHRTSCN